MPDSTEGDCIDSKCMVKNLYNHATNSRARHAKWSFFEDPIAEEQRIKEMGKAYAVIHRLTKIGSDDGESSWTTHSIEAQSPRLRKLLDEIFCDYPDWYLDATPYAVAPPFKPFVHRWDKVLESYKQHGLPTNEVELLRKELEPRLKSHLSALERVKSTKTVAFDLLWLILAPGCLMLSHENGKICVSRLRAVKFVPQLRDNPPYWHLTLDRIDWNGAYHGFAGASARIDYYEEPILVTKLDIYPLEFATNQSEIQDLLLVRGEKFASLRGSHVKTCTGKKYTLELDNKGNWKKIQKPVSGRVIIDAYAYYKCQNKVAPDLGRVTQGQPVDSTNTSESGRVHETSEEHSGKGEPTKSERKEDLRSLSDIERILAVPLVKGFDLNAKEWCEFNVDDIEEPGWSETPYENLVLPDGGKDLLFAFADHPRRSKEGFDDFVQHKGEGIIILLCGPPGVGKTLSAEAVAEKSRVPLYVLSAGDLGTNPETVESGLTKALECCHLWDAVLLLDEADVFLETRGSNSLARNELVSIFLRRLEYYQGLMFLTTNRVEFIDSAFKSRIDLILPYDDLDEESRRQVWVNFVSRLTLGVSEINDNDFDELAKFKLNGREIKNTIKTALVLAAREMPLRLKHLRTVLNIRRRVPDFNLHDSRATKRRRLTNCE
ncbi:P-loop containing nucleoside triphosphate hydrolase protein [Xylaria grammica]|nr:P-loop containing nucleoside triphosphate hydrolase protein [Xylaria grammica]